jgi:hypothetical protein
LLLHCWLHLLKRKSGQSKSKSLEWIEKYVHTPCACH